MAISPIDAAAAFDKAAKLGGSEGMGARVRPGQSSFVDLVKDVHQQALVYRINILDLLDIILHEWPRQIKAHSGTLIEPVLFP